jgi:uncharacterized protein DUF4167
VLVGVKGLPPFDVIQSSDETRQHYFMRQNQNKNRSRGRGRKPGNNPNRNYDSNGPDVKIRGSATHIHEKYQALSRDANASGDRIAAENYLQHAEHYFRLMAAAQAAQQTRNDQNQNRQQRNGQFSNSGSNTANNRNADSQSSEGTADKSETVKSEAPSEGVAADGTTQEVATVQADAASAPEKPARRRAPKTPKGNGSGEEEAKPTRKRRPRRPKVEAEASEPTPSTDDAVV